MFDLLKAEESKAMRIEKEIDEKKEELKRTKFFINYLKFNPKMTLLELKIKYKNEEC